MEIVQPEFELRAFNCPSCKAYAHMQWNRKILVVGNYLVHTASCAKCSQESLWRSQLNELTNEILETHMIFPDISVSVIPEKDMPHDVKVDFEEAKSVFHKSPKASAALLRLALQKLLKHLGEPGNNINEDIKSLVAQGKLNAAVQQAADTVRITGNNAVHPGIMNDDDIDYIAAKIFDLINFIVKKTITEPREIEEIYKSTPEGAREAITRRDAARS
ncbi:hypothetical protein AS4_17600 [Acinetobacter guillouiae]|uniref:DUF4145 domain-containing protein n=1 Tax=Acinetobacter guillouiae TaxID=106649 RepID=UPI0004EF6606|nr:DUF4145 domain-containing protein [Acinetobacter guillouiae]BAP36700.1 hypothetical protein AS4_17600 [Acinetobacter guillouiae]